MLTNFEMFTFKKMPMAKFYALTTFLLFSISVWSASFPQQTEGSSSSSTGSAQAITNSPTLGTIALQDGTPCPICNYDGSNAVGFIYGGVCNNQYCPSNVSGDPVGGEVPLGNNVLLLLIPLSIYTITKLKKRNILSV